LHRAYAGRRKGSSRGLEVTDDVLDDIVKLYVEPHRVVAMDPRDEIGTFAEEGGILLAPFDPPEVPITSLLYVATSSANICSTRAPAIFSMSS
jgi:hypothetical protein